MMELRSEHGLVPTSVDPKGFSPRCRMTHLLDQLATHFVWGCGRLTEVPPVGMRIHTLRLIFGISPFSPHRRYSVGTRARSSWHNLIFAQDSSSPRSTRSSLPTAQPYRERVSSRRVRNKPNFAVERASLVGACSGNPGGTWSGNPWQERGGDPESIPEAAITLGTPGRSRVGYWRR